MEYKGEFWCQVSNYRPLDRADCVSLQKSQVQKAVLLKKDAGGGVGGDENVRLHLFLGKEAKEGKYKVQLAVGTSVDKDLELAAQCIYREGYAVGSSEKELSFGGYRAVFSHFQPQRDVQYVLYLQFI